MRVWGQISLNLFLLLLVFSTNCLPAVNNGGQNGIHCRRRAPKHYEKTNNIPINNNVSWFYIIWIKTWSLPMVVGTNQINNDEKGRYITGNFDGCGNAGVQHDVNCLMEHIQGYTRNHWMPPSGQCLCCIAPATVMVIKIGGKH